MRGGRKMIEPESWSDPPEREDLEEGRDDWADRARPGRERCSGCGEEWSDYLVILKISAQPSE